ncbi:acetyl-CoA synthetase-like protein, partial [Cristinia sonorae]
VILPSTQALRSTTFRAPQHILEQGEIALPELYDWNAEYNPDHPLFHFEDDDGPRTISWSQGVRMIHRAAQYVSEKAAISSRDARHPPVIAILASSDTITYFCTIMGIMRAGFTVFTISPRNSPEAVAHLLSKTDAVLLLVSSEPSMAALAETAISLLRSTGTELRKGSMPVFEELFVSVTDDSFVAYPKVEYDLESPALILHSSGSTAFPKVISWSYTGLLQWCIIPWYGTVDLTGVLMSCHAMPLYHGMGSLSLCYVPSCGFVMSVFKPRSPATFPTSENLFEAMKESHCELVSCVPTFIEQWATESEKVAHLKTMKAVIFGSGPLAQDAGDYLTAQGVKLYQIYGMSECAVVNVFLSGKHPWAYFQISAHVPHDFIPRDDGTFELIMLATENWKPRVINTRHNGLDAYATSDLFTPHPTKPGFWKLYGRTDDQIMLSTGEKTNPGPLEKILNSDKHVHCAIMFGRGRFQNGVLIEPKSEYAFDPADVAQVEEFKNAIWPTVVRMNEFAPQHSRIFKEMILVSSPSKPFTFTAKGTPRRQAIINEYDAEINALYDAVQYAFQNESIMISEWTVEETTQFVRETIKAVMHKSIADHDDIFQFGCDSLQATWIRNTILQALRPIDGAADRLPSNFVFKAPTVAGMTNLLLQFIHPSTETPNEDARITELLKTVAKFTTDFPSRPDTARLRHRTDDGDTVFVTGTTGGFGCNILAQLTHDPTVKKIYAFNRPSEDIIQRQLYAMQKQGLLEECMRASKFEMIEGDLARPYFGLDPEVYEKLRTSVTHIIHNAWPVDFNLTLKSFERSLQGVRSLVDFALSSSFTVPPQILFVSSIGIFRREQTVSEEPVKDPAIVVGTGYAESKWVAEQILSAASERFGLRTVSVRIGQLCGDRNGHWNEKEWFPSIVKSALYTNCLPDVTKPGLVSWIPSYDGAKAIIAMRNSEEPILHLVNPNPVPWRTFLEPLAQAMNVSLVPYEQWLPKLGDCLGDRSLPEVEHLKRNPALRLLDYYRALQLNDDMEPLGIVRLNTTKAVHIAPSLLEMPLSAELAVRWLKSWRMSSFLP